MEHNVPYAVDLFTEQKCCISVQASEAARGKKITVHERAVDGASVTGIFV
jgi:hypothetical protein